MDWTGLHRTELEWLFFCPSSSPLSPSYSDRFFLSLLILCPYIFLVNIQFRHCVIMTTSSTVWVAAVVGFSPKVAPKVFANWAV